MSSGDPDASDIDRWEAAYLRFETPAQEIEKFRRRLLWMGAEDWPAASRIAELFCGRGSGLHALRGLGFENLAGLDLSPALLTQHSLRRGLTAADCRCLPLADGCRDMVIVQGGLHHLLHLPDDLEAVLDETQRILVPGGLFCVVEPWLTPFLKAAHFACDQTWLRRLWPRLDALAEMIELESPTYERWLHAPELILSAIDRRFSIDRLETSRGKLRLVGRKA